MKFIAALILICSSTIAFSQNGDVKIIKDSRIDGLVGGQGVIVPPAINPQIKGYRIQLFFDTDRSALSDARSTFFAKYPRVDTYTTYKAPNFFLRAGDFRTRLEAEKIKSEVNALFPTSFIVEEDVNLPRLEKDRKDP
ncbi:MAG: hypothetical protein ACI865_001302 [Flavobacteriaceae bacterium]|jgi:hypothetical protein